MLSPRRTRSESSGEKDGINNAAIGVLRGHKDIISHIHIVDDVALTASEDKTVRVWNLKDDTCTSTFGPFEQKILWTGCMPHASVEESKFCYIALSNKLIKYDVLNANAVKDLKWPANPTNPAETPTFKCAVFYQPNNIIIGTSDGTIYYFDIFSGSIVSKMIKAHSNGINDLQLDTKLNILVSASDDKMVKIWDLETLSLTKTLDLNTFHYSYCLPICLALSGGLLFVGIKEKEVLMFSTTNLELICRFGPHPTSIRMMKVLEGTLVVASGEVIVLWSILDRTRVATLEPQQSWITTLDINNNRIVTAGTSELIYVYRYQTRVMSLVKDSARKKLKELELSYCQLSDLPTILLFAKWLTNLNLSHNSFYSIPSEIASLSSLQTLNLNNNNLDSLPAEFELLTSLTSVSLSSNKFKMLPLELASLVNLKKLSIADNQMTFLLPFLTKLPLNSLEVAGNPLEDPPLDIAKSGIIAIMEHLKSKSSGVPIPVHRVKLMLVGNENVGKTSLVLNLRHKSSIFNSKPNIKTLSTPGISIETLKTVVPTKPNVPSSSEKPIPQLGIKEFSKSDKKAIKRKVKWYTWDFGGQEIYYNTHQFFITPHSIYLIAFNVTKPLDDNNLHFWIRCIQARTSTSRGTHSYSGDTTAGKRAQVPIILVGTHVDAFDKSQLPWLKDLFLENSKEYISLIAKKDDAFLETYFAWILKKFSSEYPNVLWVTGVSSKTGKGIKELKAGLRNIIDTSAAIHNQVNATAAERVFLLEQLILKAKSARMPPILSWRQYQVFASGCMDDPVQLLEATKLLANLGSLVYLPSSSRKNSWLVSLGQLIPEDFEPNNPYVLGGTEDELIVLDPQWLVDLFATILGTSPNFVRNGLIRTSDLSMIWKDHAKFPPTIHNELIRILEYFDVAFSLGTRKKNVFELNPAPTGLPAPKLKEIRDMSATPNNRNPQTHRRDQTKEANPSCFSEGYQSKAAAKLVQNQTTPANVDLYHYQLDGHSVNGPPTHLFPSLLPSGTPQLDILWPEYECRFQVDRNYYFPKFLPLGLFSRLMVRLLLYFPSYYYWRQGIVISDDTKRAYALVQEFGSENRVKITVRGPVNAVSHFLISVMDIWSKLIFDMYDIKVVQTTTCYHCTANREPEPHLFELSYCEILVASGDRFAQCSNGGTIRLDQLCPELCLVNIQQLEIDPKDILPWKNDPPDGGILGEGGFGVVYRKSYKGKLVAVKKFKEIKKKGLQPEDLAKIHTAFRNEIWLMSGAAHPNIVKLIGFSLRHESIMVMEYIPGGDLYEALISDRELTWPLRMRIALDIARGMAALHGLNPPLCHSDLKCPNCMIVAWDEDAPIVAQVSDFGLSSRLYGDQLTKTPTMNPFWTAPEILAELPFDTSVDVYSFGVILWNLVSRKALFEEMLPWTDEVSRAVRSGKRPPIPADPEMPSAYAALIKQCWQHRASQRPRFPQICVELEKMISEHFPQLVPIVEKTRSEMISVSNAKNQDIITSSLVPSGSLSDLLAASSTDPAKLLSLRASNAITSTWTKAGSKSDQENATFYNNSKLANYGTTLLKKMDLGSSITLMVVVGLAQVWAYSRSMGLIYVINSVSGQFLKSFIAPKDIECMIEVNFKEGWAEVWTAGKSGISIWNGETAQLITTICPNVHYKSLLHIYRPDKRGVIWAGLAGSAVIQLWGASTRDLLKIVTLDLTSDCVLLSNKERIKTSNPTSSAEKPRRKSSNTRDFVGVSSMILGTDCIWAACGKFILRLSASTGQRKEIKSALSEEIQNFELPSLDTPAAVTPMTSAEPSPASTPMSSPDPNRKFESPSMKKDHFSCFEAHPGGVRCMAHSRLQMLWTCGKDDTLRIWNSTTGKLLKVVPNYSPRQLLVVDRTQLWATQAEGADVDVWNTESGELVNKVNTEHSQPVNRIMLVFNKTIWTAGQDERVHVFT